MDLWTIGTTTHVFYENSHESYIYWFNDYTSDPDQIGEGDNYVTFNGYQYYVVSWDSQVDNEPAQCVGPIVPPLQGPQPYSSIEDLMTP